MTDVELIDALNVYLQHQPACSIDPCTCGLNTLLEALVQRLIAPQHPAPDLTTVREQVDRAYAQRVVA